MNDAMSIRSARFAVCCFALLALPACKSPADVGERAGVIYIAPFASVGADTVSMPCPERLALAEEFVGKTAEKRADLGSDVEGARDGEGFDTALKKVVEPTRTKVFEAFAKACPAEAPKLAALMESAEDELGIRGKLDPLSAG